MAMDWEVWLTSLDAGVPLSPGCSAITNCVLGPPSILAIRADIAGIQTVEHGRHGFQKRVIVLLK